MTMETIGDENLELLWADVTTEWVNCLQLTENPILSLNELADGNFFREVLRLLFGKPIPSSEIYAVFQCLKRNLNGYYAPEDWINFSKAQFGEEGEIVKLIFVLISITAFQESEKLFQRNPAEKLAYETQILIREFLLATDKNKRIVSPRCLPGIKSHANSKLPDHLCGRITMQPRILFNEKSSRDDIRNSTMSRIIQNPASLSSPLNELYQTMDSEKLLLSEKNNEITKLRNKLQVFTEIERDSHEELSKYKKEVSKLRTELIESNKMIKQLQDKISLHQDLTADSKTLASEIANDEIERRFNELNEKLKKKLKHNEKLEDENYSLKTEIEDCRKEKLEYHNKNREFERCTKELEEQIKSMHSETNLLQDKLKIKDEKIEDLEQLCLELKEISDANRASSRIEDSSFVSRKSTSSCRDLQLESNEDLGTVIDLKLREALDEILVLKEENENLIINIGSLEEESRNKDKKIESEHQLFIEVKETLEMRLTEAWAAKEKTDRLLEEMCQQKDQEIENKSKLLSEWKETSEKKLKEISDEIVSCEQNNKTLVTEIRNLEEVCRSKDKKFESEHQLYLQQKQTLESALKEALADIVSSKQKNENMVTEIRNLEEECLCKDKKIESEHQLYIQQKQTSEQALKEVWALGNEKIKLLADLRNLEKMCQEKELEVDKKSKLLSQWKETSEKELKEIRDEVVLCEQKNQTLVTEIRNLVEECRIKDEKIESEHELLTQLKETSESALKVALADVASYKQKNENLVTEISNLEEECQSKDKKIESEHQLFIEVKETLEMRLTEASALAKEKIDKLHEELGNLEEMCQQKDQEIENKSKLLLQLKEISEKELKEKSDEIVLSNEKIENLVTEIRNLEEEYRIKDEKIESVLKLFTQLKETSDNELKEKSDEVVLCKEENENLVADIRNLEEICQQKDQEIENKSKLLLQLKETSENELKEKSDEIVLCKQKNESLVTEIRNLEEECRIKDEKIESEHKLFTQLKETSESALKEVLADVASSKQKNENLVTEIRNLEEECRIKDEKIESVLKLFTQLKETSDNELKEKSDEVVLCKQKNESLVTEIRNLEEECLSKDRKIDNGRELFTQLKETSESTLKEVLADVASSKEKNESLVTEIRDLEEECRIKDEKIESEHKLFTQLKETSESALKEALADVASSKEKNESLVTEIRDFEEECRIKDEKIESEHKLFTQLKETSETALKEALADVASSKEKNECLITEIRKLKEECQLKDKEIECDHQKLEETEIKLQEVLSENQNLKFERESRESTFDSVINNLKIEVQNATKADVQNRYQVKFESMKQHFKDMLEKEEKDRNAKLQSAKEEVENLKRERARLRAESLELNSTIYKLNKEILKLKQKFSELKNDNHKCHVPAPDTTVSERPEGNFSSGLERSISTLSLVSNVSNSSTGSRAKVVPFGSGHLFSCEDEEDFQFSESNLAKLKAGVSTVSDVDRVQEIQRRNTLVPPHMKSCYPAEFQFLPSNVDEENIRVPLPDTFKCTARRRTSVLPFSELTNRQRGNSIKSYNHSQVSSKK